MSSWVNWSFLTTPHYDSSASVSMLIPWCQIVLFSMVSLVSFFSWCQIVFFFSWCQIVLFSMVSNCPLYFLGVKLSSFFSWCQIILFSMVSNCPLYFHIMASIPLCFHNVKSSSDPPHCDSSALVSLLMKPRCWHRRRLEGGLICPQPLVLSKTRSDQITPNQTILCHTIHYTFMFQCIK